MAGPGCTPWGPPGYCHQHPGLPGQGHQRGFSSVPSVPRAQVLVYELLLGRGFRGAGGGRWKQVLSRHQARLKAELARLKVQRGVSRNEDLLDVGSKPGGGESPRGWGVLDPSVGPPKKKGCLSGCAPCQLTHIVSQPPRCPGLCV